MIQFAVWGVGNLGKRLVKMLGKEKIAAYIDSDSKLQNTVYQDIPVLSYSCYQDMYKNIPIIITPKGHEEEIMQQLNENDRLIAYNWLNEMDVIMGFLVQAPMEKIIAPYKKKKRIAVYGESLLSVILASFFKDWGYSVDSVFPCDMDLRRRKYCEEVLKLTLIDLQEIRDGLILAQKLQDADMLWVQEHGIKTDVFYDLGIRKELYYNPAIERFKGVHCNERCFIVATGPSLRIEDLNLLHEKGEICISVNGIFKAFDKTKWRPDYYMASDPAFTMTWYKEILEMDVKEKFIADVAWISECEEINSYFYKWHLQKEKFDGEYPNFSDDFSRCSYWGCTIVYEGALQLAVYMGVKEIYLLGVDCNYVNGSRSNHFFEDNVKDTMDHQERNMILAYQAAEQYAKAHGIKIYNATRGGKLEVFERVSFDMLFD